MVNMKMLSRILFLTLFFIAFGNEIKAKDEPVKFKLNPKSGTTLRFKEQNSQVQLVNGDSNVSRQITYGTWFFPERKGDTIIAVWSSNRIVYEKSVGLKSDYVDTDSGDEDVEDDNIMLAMFKAMLGKKLTIKFSENADLYAVEGSKEMMDSIMNVLILKNKKIGEDVRKLVSGMIDENTFKTNLTRMFSYMPKGKSVKKGSRWKSNTNTKSGFMKIASSSTFTLDEINNNKYIVSQRGTSTVTGKTEMEYSGMKVKMAMNMKAAITGNSHLDLNTLWVKSYVTTSLLKGSVTTIVQNEKTVTKQVITTVSKLEILD